MRTHQGRPRLSHALRLRCPLCGHRPITHKFGELVEQCPGCGYAFEKEEGYWVGALIVNMAMVIVSFAVAFALGLALTWPDVPWTVLTIACMVVVGIVPIVFYPLSKTIWIWVDLTIHPYTDQERLSRF